MTTKQEQKDGDKRKLYNTYKDISKELADSSWKSNWLQHYKQPPT